MDVQPEQWSCDLVCTVHHRHCSWNHHPRHCCIFDDECEMATENDFLQAYE